MPQLGSTEPNTDNRNLSRRNTSLQHQFSPVPGCSAEHTTCSTVRARTNRAFSGIPNNQTALCHATKCSAQAKTHSLPGKENLTPHKKETHAHQNQSTHSGAPSQNKKGKSRANPDSKLCRGPPILQNPQFAQSPLPHGRGQNKGNFLQGRTPPRARGPPRGQPRKGESFLGTSRS